ncbi:MAG: single-stranded-DNA-specific exonuclease RecJ [Candidatus Levyibacteriota bacterium]
MKSGKKWEILSSFQTDPKTFKHEDLLDILLKNRNITKKDSAGFLHPKLSDVTIASVGIDKKQLAKAKKRLEKAISQKEKIVVYGDYDVDGITASAIVWETLFAKKADVTPYIPHRVDEGYGLSILGIDNLLLQVPETKIIITVDNGIVANKAVAYAKEKNIDVIITDHHTVGEKLPEAFVIIHTTKLCGAGVAWMFMQEFGKNNNHLDLVALATVADLVPLINANRTLLTFGLKHLQQTKRKGLLALFNEAQIDAKNIYVYTIGHIIAPRLNAMGRMKSAMDSLRLLCTTDNNRAEKLAQTLGITNRQRQLVTKESAFHAIETVKNKSGKMKNILFIAEETYEEGIIGLVAGKLVETYYRPSIVVSKKDGVSKASARSIHGFNIIEFIRTSSHLLIDAGGHPMAAGFTIATEKITLLQETLEKLAQEKVTDDMLQRILKIDCELPLEIVDKNLFVKIQSLSPFGMGNVEPVFASSVLIRGIRTIGKEGNHLKLTLSPASKTPITFEAIGFGMGEYAENIHEGDEIIIAYTIDENTWNGKTTLQLKMKDIK